jgi:hypothetical protein
VARASISLKHCTIFMKVAPKASSLSMKEECVDL